MRVKCKNCQRWLKGEHRCAFKHDVHSPGKKRWCGDFAQVFVEKKEIPIFKSRYMTKEEKKKEKLKTIENKAKLKELEKEVEQRKLIETAIAPDTFPKEKIEVKKPGFFQKIFKRITP